MLEAGYAAPEIAERAQTFANLLVKDVLDILKDPKNYNRYVYTTFDASQANAVAQELINKIKEHFKDTE